MSPVTPIRTIADYYAALSRMDAPAGSAEADELDILADLVEHYESKEHPIGAPDPISAIEFRMDQQGLTLRDLIPYIGSRSKVSEVLSGRRGLTMSMVRALHKGLGIPADVLLRSRAQCSTAHTKTLLSSDSL